MNTTNDKLREAVERAMQTTNRNPGFLRDRILAAVAPVMAEEQPINTHVRLFDLVRQMRAELHEAELITDEEYAWLSGGAPMATSPKGGSPSPRRLEDYDELRATVDRLTAALETEKANNRYKIAEVSGLTAELAEARNELHIRNTELKGVCAKLDAAKEAT